MSKNEKMRNKYDTVDIGTDHLLIINKESDNDNKSDLSGSTLLHFKNELKDLNLKQYNLSYSAPVDSFTKSFLWSKTEIVTLSNNELSIYNPEQDKKELLTHVNKLEPIDFIYVNGCIFFIKKNGASIYRADAEGSIEEVICLEESLNKISLSVCRDIVVVSGNERFFILKINISKEEKVLLEKTNIELSYENKNIQYDYYSFKKESLQGTGESEELIYLCSYSEKEVLVYKFLCKETTGAVEDIGTINISVEKLNHDKIRGAFFFTIPYPSVTDRKEHIQQNISISNENSPLNHSKESVTIINGLHLSSKCYKKKLYILLYTTSGCVSIYFVDILDPLSNSLNYKREELLLPYLHVQLPCTICFLQPPFRSSYTKRDTGTNENFKKVCTEETVSENNIIFDIFQVEALSLQLHSVQFDMNCFEESFTENMKIELQENGTTFRVLKNSKGKKRKNEEIQMGKDTLNDMFFSIDASGQKNETSMVQNNLNKKKENISEKENIIVGNEKERITEVIGESDRKKKKKEEKNEKRSDKEKNKNNDEHVEYFKQHFALSSMIKSNLSLKKYNALIDILSIKDSELIKNTVIQICEESALDLLNFLIDTLEKKKELIKVFHVWIKTISNVYKKQLKKKSHRALVSKMNTLSSNYLKYRNMLQHVISKLDENIEHYEKASSMNQLDVLNYIDGSIIK